MSWFIKRRTVSLQQIHDVLTERSNGLVANTYLRSVTWAHELIVRGGPWYNTSQMGTYSIKSVTFESLVLLYDKVAVGKGREMKYVIKSFTFSECIYAHNHAVDG
jgi:hypothetical protein